jgi:hypothetical protein
MKKVGRFMGERWSWIHGVWGLNQEKVHWAWSQMKTEEKRQ